MDKPKIIGVIPARAGSQGIIGKNTTDLLGKPMIEYTFDAARDSGLTKTYLTTDDDDAIELAKKHGAITVPFKRPAELASNDAEMLDVMYHLLDWIEENEGYTPEAIFLLQPTSPLRTAKDIDECLKIYEENDVDSVIAVTDVGAFTPYKMKKVGEDGLLKDLMDLSNLPTTNREKLPKVYLPNGAVYFVKTKALREDKTFYGKRSKMYYMEPHRSTDIDYPLDLVVAKYLMENNSK